MSKPNYLYSLDKRLERCVPSRLLPCSLDEAGIIKKVHRHLKPRVYNAELLFHHQRPLCVERRGRQVQDANGTVCNEPRLRLVYYCYRDISEYPTFTKRLADQRVTSGRTTSLAVDITGFPAPEVHWLKDGQPLKPTDNLEVVQYGNHAQALWIRNAVPSDSGYYQCVATNVAGTIRTTGRVRVEPHSGAYLPVRRRTCERIGFSFRH